MRRFALVLAVTLAALPPLFGSAVTLATAQEDEWGGLPPGEGREIVHSVCTGCHSAKIITQQGMRRSRWDDTLDWMVEKQGMAELDGEIRKIVLDYLAENIGETRTPADRGLSPYATPRRPLLTRP